MLLSFSGAFERCHFRCEVRFGMVVNSCLSCRSMKLCRAWIERKPMEGPQAWDDAMSRGP